MIDGFKNREVVQERYKSALNDLTQAERNQYLRDGQITVEDMDVFVRREVEERRSTRHETREHDLESILHAEFFACDTASDGVPFTHFLHMDYGFVSVIRFSDNTLHIHCDAEILQDYFRDLYQEYECEMFDGFIRVDLNKKKPEDWKIELIKRQLNS